MRYFYVVIRTLENDGLERTSGSIQAAETVADLILHHRKENTVISFYDEITKKEYDRIKKSIE